MLLEVRLDMRVGLHMARPWLWLAMIRQRTADPLDPWLEQMRASRIPQAPFTCLCWSREFWQKRVSATSTSFRIHRLVFIAVRWRPSVVNFSFVSYLVRCHHWSTVVTALWHRLQQVHPVPGADNRSFAASKMRWPLTSIASPADLCYHCH